MEKPVRYNEMNMYSWQQEVYIVTEEHLIRVGHKCDRVPNHLEFFRGYSDFCHGSKANNVIELNYISKRLESNSVSYFTYASDVLGNIITAYNCLIFCEQ